MTKEEITKEKDLIVSQISAHVPYFGKFFTMDVSIKEFSENLYNFKVADKHIGRQKLIKQKLEEKIKSLFGQNALAELSVQWGDKLAFNIADHHQMLGHPFLLSANVVSGINKFCQKEKQPATLVISSGDIPPNNYFSKSGFCLHGKRVPLFSASERELTTYYIPKRNFNIIERLKASHRLHEFNKHEQEFLTEHQTLLEGLDYSLCKDYVDQITVIVKETWPLLFEENIRKTIPELLYLTQEELISECLIYILREDNFISSALFDNQFQQKILNNFRGIVVAWNEPEQKGTHFFWKKYPGKNQSLRMYVEGEYLVPQDERFKDQKIHLDPDTLIDLLKKREIYPSLFLIFSVLNFYAGVRPLTGFGSTVYLALFREAWLKTLKNTEFEEEIPLIADINTTSVVAGLVLFFKRYEEKLKACYAHDILCDGPITQEYLEKVFNMPFKDVLSVGIADMYDYFSQKYIPPKEKINKKINFDDLATLYFDYIK